MFSIWIGCCETNSPDRVNRTGFNQHSILGLKQIIAQCGILPKLVQAALEYNLKSLSLPNALVEIAYFPTQSLRRAW